MNEVLHINGIIAPEGDFLPEEKNYTSARKVQDFINNSESDQICVELNTPGGSVDEGFVIYDLLKNSGKKIIINAYQANSIGTVILLAGDNDGGRNVSDNFQGLVHNAWLDPQYLLGEQLNAQMLGELKDEAERNDARILSLYCSTLGKEKETELLALMQSETIMNADKAIQLGFATGKIEPKKTAKALRSFAFSNQTIKIIKNQMEKDQLIQKFESALTKALDKFSNLFKTKNMAVELADGKKIYVDTEDGQLVGKAALLMEGDAPTETKAPAGTHKLKDGREIVVDESGIVQEVKEAPPVETVESLKEAMAKQKAEYDGKISAMEEEKKKSVAQAESAQAEVKNLAKEFADFKNQIIADPDDEEEKAKQRYAEMFQNKKPSELTEAEKMIKRVLNKY